MGVSVAWLYTRRSASPSYDGALIPDQGSDETALDYYARLGRQRDAIVAATAPLLIEAVDEADRDEPELARTQLAAELGLSEAYLYRQLREHTG